MGNSKAWQKYEQFWAKHGGHRGIPDRGYCFASLRNDAAALVCVPTLATARQGAKLLANAAGRRVDLIKVEGRGEDRSTIAEIYPKNWGALQEQARRRNRGE